ncbi:MAG TPA: META domain-containing protein [bacterium]|nr:META domain-containing protein [bacterium]
MKTRSILFALAFASALAVPAVAAADVVGTLSYPAGTVLPAGATVEAQVLDEFAADAPNVIAHTEIPASPPPQKIVLKVDPAKIQGNHPYTFVVSVKSAGRYVLYAPQKYSVLTFGHPSQVAVRMADVPVQPEYKPYGPALEETYWKLTALGAIPVTTGAGREAFVRLNAFNHTLAGTGGCNNVRGSYEANAKAVFFKDMATTRMACPASAHNDDALLNVLQSARKFQIRDDRLYLMDAGGATLATFQGVPPQPLIGGR